MSKMKRGCGHSLIPGFPHVTEQTYTKYID